MNVKGLVVSSGKDLYNVFDCEISLPSLKVSLSDNDLNKITPLLTKSEYTNVMFMLNGSSFEVALYKKDEKHIYANAKELSSLDLSMTPILKENNIIKKFISIAEKRKL